MTSSRLHAVRYKQNIDKYINANGYTDIRTLVAFSGKIDDGRGRPLSETNMNGLPESRTAEEFATPEYGVLIAAEKFQTGFDQPLLHTMYVDKPLVGLAAVQTLSRLNRIHPLKQSTFVLDFRNDTEDVVAAFEQFHGCTVAPPTDPNILWDTRRRLDDFDVLRSEEVEAAMPALLGAGASEEKRSAETYAALAPAKARFEELDASCRPRRATTRSRTSASSSRRSSCRRSSPAPTPTTRSSSESSTTKSSPLRSASSTCGRSTSGCERASEAPKKFGRVAWVSFAPRLFVQPRELLPWLVS